MIRPSIPVPPSLLTVAERVEERLDAFLTAETPPVGRAERRPGGAARVAARAGAGRRQAAAAGVLLLGLPGRRRRPRRPAVIEAGAAFELLQAFALVHDDVMDGSATRRGARTAHLVVRRPARRGRLARRATTVR